MTSAAKERANDLARVRSNQRRSRARRKEYIHELEEKVRQCERRGVHATAEMQATARAIAAENVVLRRILWGKGIWVPELGIGETLERSLLGDMGMMGVTRKRMGSMGMGMGIPDDLVGHVVQVPDDDPHVRMQTAHHHAAAHGTQGPVINNATHAHLGATSPLPVPGESYGMQQYAEPAPDSIGGGTQWTLPTAATASVSPSVVSLDILLPIQNPIMPSTFPDAGIGASGPVPEFSGVAHHADVVSYSGHADVSQDATLTGLLAAPYTGPEQHDARAWHGSLEESFPRDIQSTIPFQVPAGDFFDVDAGPGHSFEELYPHRQEHHHHHHQQQQQKQHQPHHPDLLVTSSINR